MNGILQNIWCFHQEYFWQSLTNVITRMLPIPTKKSDIRYVVWKLRSCGIRRRTDSYLDTFVSQEPTSAILYPDDGS